MKKLIALFLISPALTFAQATLGDAVGTVVFKREQSAVYNARVETSSNGTFYRARTDEDGRFRISAIPSGKYIFSVIYEGDTLTDLVGNVPIDGILNFGKIEFIPKLLLKTMKATPHIMPKLTYGVQPEITMDLEQIKRSPQKFNQKEMIASMSSDIKLMDDGSLVFRGARKGDMIYIMDGVKMTEITNVPSASIGGMMVFTGGIPAKYGDTTGGVVVMETLSYFDLYRNWYAAQLKKEL